MINDDDAEIEGHGRAFHDEYDDAAMRSAMEAACDAATPTGDAADPGEPGRRGRRQVSRELDRVSAAAGVAVTVMGVLLLLDQEDVVELSLGLVGALIAAVLGAILIVSGLGEEAGER